MQPIAHPQSVCPGGSWSIALLLSVNSSSKDFTDRDRLSSLFLLVLSAGSLIDEKAWRKETLPVI